MRRRGWRRCRGSATGRRSVLTLASTSSTYIAPGGAAVGMAARTRCSGAGGSGAGRSRSHVAVTGIWNQFAMLGFPIVALAALTLQHEQNGLLQTVALIGLASSSSPSRRSPRASGRRARASRSATSRRGSRTGALKLIRRGPGRLGRARVRPFAERDGPASSGAAGICSRSRRSPGSSPCSWSCSPRSGSCGVSAGDVTFDRSVRGLVARAPARLAADHARRARHRRGRSHRRPRRLRRPQRRRRRRRPDLPLPHDRPDAAPRPPRRSDLAPAQPGRSCDRNLGDRLGAREHRALEQEEERDRTEQKDRELRAPQRGERRGPVDRRAGQVGA